jgi:hypothetical protein
MRGRRRRAVTLTALSLTCLLGVAGCRPGEGPGWPGGPHPGPTGTHGPKPRPPHPKPTRTKPPTPTQTGSPTATPSVTATPSPTTTPSQTPPQQVTLPATPPAADPLLQVLGTTPQPPPPWWNSGVVTLTPDGQFVLFEYDANSGSDPNGNQNPTPARVGLVAPGGTPQWFRPLPTDAAEFRRITGGDAAGDWVVWREEPFRGTPGDTVLYAHNRATGATVELLRVSAPVTVQKPRILGGRVYWEQRDTALGQPAVRSVALTGGTPRLDVAGATNVAVDRCGTASDLLYAVTSADGATATVHRRTVTYDVLGPDTTVLTRALGGPSVLGLAACDGDVAISTGFPGVADFPEWIRGRILLQDAGGGAVEFALPAGRTGRDLVLSDRLLGFVGLYMDPFQAQQQVIVDRPTNQAYLLAATPGGTYTTQTALVSFAAGDLVAWNTIVNFTYSQGVAARYVGAPGG